MTLLKLVFSVISLAILSNNSYCQVGIGTNSPDPSSVLDLNSNIKGFLPPRMTFEERNNIANPAAGLIVWCKNCWAKGELQVYNGYEWTNLVGDIAKSPIKRGDLYGGGVVGYVYINGDPGFVEGETHGFVVKATNNVSLVWGCYTIELPGAESTLLGGGLQNTADIVNSCLTTGIAAHVCFYMIENGFSDWVLPSKDELAKMYLNRNYIQGFQNTIYYSSSEDGPNAAWGQSFSTGNQVSVAKNISYNVRAIRYF